MIKKDSSAKSVFSACGLSSKMLARIARETGFSKRAGGKISAADFLAHFSAESIEGTVSGNDIAATLHAATGVSVSRQACWERIDDQCLSFFKAVLEKLIHLRVTSEGWMTCPKYKRILIQDSTIIQLPAKLYKSFSGVRNATSTTCHARIQGVYDLCAGRFTQFSIDPYFKNDLSVAADIQVSEGDLLLRDRGYFVLSVISMHKANGVDTISRYKHKTMLHDAQTQEKIDLLDLLTRDGTVDMMVMAGENKELNVRLLAVPVPEEVANLRRMKAKKETKGHAPSSELLALMSWSIFLVTVPDSIITIKHVMAIYGLRWRIENIFKTWKSYFNFSRVHQVSENHLRILLTARLIMISICFHNAYVPLFNAIKHRTQQHLSLIKFMRYVCQNPSQLPTLVAQRLWSNSLLKAIARYCAYDKRKRSTFVDNLLAVFEDLSDIASSLA